MMQKSANIEAKIGLKYRAIVWNADFHFFRGYYLFYIIVLNV